MKQDKPMKFDAGKIKVKMGLLTKWHFLVIRNDFNIYIFIYPRFFVVTDLRQFIKARKNL